MIATIVKQPGETLRQLVPFAAGVIRVDSVVVAARGLVVSAAAVLAVATIVGGAGVELALSGGSDGERYLATVRAELVGGALAESEVEIAVVEASWQLPDGGVPYLSIVDFVRKFGLDEVVRMTDIDGTGRVDRGLLTGALTDAQAIADAHLAGRYALPLTAVPAMVAMAIADLARNRLYPRGAPEGVADAAKAANRYLERIQSGAMPLPIAGTGAPAEAVNAEPVLISAGHRRYRDGLADY